MANILRFDIHSYVNMTEILKKEVTQIARSSVGARRSLSFPHETGRSKFTWLALGSYSAPEKHII